MSAVASVTLEVADPAATQAFHKAFLGPDAPVDVRPGEPTAGGFGGYTLSLVVSGPSAVDRIVGSALDAGATAVKPVTKSFWGYGGTFRGPDGAVWKVATSSKKDTAPADRAVDSVVLLLGCADVKASKQFHVERGLVVARGFGSRYVEFAPSGGPVTLALLGRRALAKDAGVDADDTDDRHGIVIHGDAGTFTDPDGFAWEESRSR